MISKQLTDSEVRKNFDSAIKNAVELGLPPPSDQGFDEWTKRAIMAVALDYPETNAERVALAHKEIQGQLSGAHKARHEARWRAVIDSL